MLLQHTSWVIYQQCTLIYQASGSQEGQDQGVSEMLSVGAYLLHPPEEMLCLHMMEGTEWQESAFYSAEPLY